MASSIFPCDVFPGEPLQTAKDLIVGKTDTRGLICTPPIPKNSTNREGNFSLTFIEFENESSENNHLKKELSINTKSTETNAQNDPTHYWTEQITHASLKLLNKHSQGDEQNRTKKTSNSIELFYLLGLVKHRSSSESGSSTSSKYSASLLLLKESVGECLKIESKKVSKSSTKWEVLEEIIILDDQEKELRLHLLPTRSNPSEESDTDTTEESHLNSICYKNRVLLFTLDECITMYEIETLPHSSLLSSRLEILTSECVVKSFWWAQWVPQYEFLAFAHIRKLRQSNFDDDDEPASSIPSVKTLLSVLQFHESFPRESVLNMPLEIDPKSELPLAGQLILDPNVLSSTFVQLKLIAHTSGAVYIFQIDSSSAEQSTQITTDQMYPLHLKYSVNILHHNKTLNVSVGLTTEQKSLLPLKIDLLLYSTDQYLLVIGWPIFIHILDVGTTHEPSHHLVFDCESLLGKRLSPFICLCSSSPNPVCDEKLDFSTKNCVNFIFQDLSHKPLELNSSILLPLMEKADLKFKLAVMHHLLVHSTDLNVAKRIIYDEGKKSANIHLKQIYQEFLIGYAHLQTKKQILPNMESFLYLVPYSPNPELDYSNPAKGLLMQLQTNTTDVTTMLLSPSQRVFPHNITDVWTSLWQINRQFTRSKRFNHKNVAEKLLLSLQCYKPEALSRASTPGPMSPSSPMICTSLGDIAGLFGRRTTELQLPFVEHESCTANKQEYIFSINLRELSMHLLKERKEWPLHGHTVAGKYVCALGDTARLLCHLVGLTVHLQPTKTRDKGFKLIDTLEWDTRLKLFMLMEHYTLALGTLACPLPQGFTPFFAYLGYRVLKFDQFLWHVRAGTFDLQIDLVKNIMADLKDSEEGNVAKKLHLLSLLPKSRANRVLNTWSHPMSICLRARQHSSDLLSGVVSQTRKSHFTTQKKKKGESSVVKDKQNLNPLDTFFQLLTAKANASDIDLGLLTEATMISMEEHRSHKNGGPSLTK